MQLNHQRLDVFGMSVELSPWCMELKIAVQSFVSFGSWCSALLSMHPVTLPSSLVALFVCVGCAGRVEDQDDTGASGREVGKDTDNSGGGTSSKATDGDGSVGGSLSSDENSSGGAQSGSGGLSDRGDPSLPEETAGGGYTADPEDLDKNDGPEVVAALREAVPLADIDDACDSSSLKEITYKTVEAYESLMIGDWLVCPPVRGVEEEENAEVKVGFRAYADGRLYSIFLNPDGEYIEGKGLDHGTNWRGELEGPGDGVIIIFDDALSGSYFRPLISSEPTQLFFPEPRGVFDSERYVYVGELDLLDP